MENDREGTLSIPAYVGLVIVYLVVIQGLGLLLGQGLNESDGPFVAPENLLRVAAIPIALSLLLVVTVATRLAWWQSIVHEDHPVQTWVRRVPIVMALAALIAADYGNVAGQEVGLVLSLLGLLLMVGAAEELLFRGIGVVTFRRAGFSEAKVALWTSVIFGASHLTNAISTGTGAIAQAAIVSFAGYFFYLTRRASGGIAAGIALHSLWDFGLLSGRLGPDPSVYAPSIVPVLAVIYVAALLVRRRRQIEPSSEPAS